jgi:hypothetical protein
MTSGDNGSALAGEVLRAVAEEYGWPSQKPVSVKTVVLSDAQLKTLAGEYQDGDLKLQVAAVGTSLQVTVFGQAMEFVPETELRFVPMGDGPPALVFEKDTSGAVIGLSAAGRKLKKL